MMISRAHKPTRNTKTFAVIAAAIVMMAAPPSNAADPSRLGGDLTAMGANPAANKEGTIPAFAPGEALLPGWTAGKKRADFFKFKNDKPQFTIDASNVDKYADKLSPGQVALIKEAKGYAMEVYPTRRTCSAPAFVLENTKKNVSMAKMGDDGWSLKEATVPGVPFPIPANGAEVMWNNKFRYTGIGVELPRLFTSLSPRKGATDWVSAGYTINYFYPWGKKGSTSLSQLPPVEIYTYFAYESPTALAGQAAVLSIYTDKPSETFYYFPGQRRVRRMPTYAYDAPQIGFENQYTVDEPRIFSGTMDRFDWKLIGKKEMYVAYNSYGMYDYNAKIGVEAAPDGINKNSRRYELHRVWVVEATVKSGVRHAAPKRTFYIDEDSWALTGGEDYDGQGKLWKYREAFVIPVAETGTCDNLQFVQYNLLEGRYLIDNGSFAAGKDMRWVVESNEPKFKESFYTSDNLRAISER